jgi:toxin ParE1/3/4
VATPRITRAAERDLIEISRYTRERWGSEQARRYVSLLDARFVALAKNPQSGRPRDDIRTGYWCARESRHAIFYRLMGVEVEIVRVLHERMLPELHL